MMLDCSKFLEEYSSYRDGMLAPWEEERFEAHRDACDSCRRYDRLISTGVERYRDCPVAPLSEDFQLRLQHRILHLEDELRGRPRNTSGAQAALTLALAATIAAIAWIPVARMQPGELQLPPIAARAPLPPAPASESPRFVPGLPADADPAAAPGVWSGWGAFAGESDPGRRAAFGADFRVRQVLQH
jgi:hypothetical protein